MRDLKVFEKIISILEEKGPLSIPLICNEVNKQMVTEREKPLLPSQIKSIVKRKKDLFLEEEGNVSIQPDKYPFKLVAIVEGDDGITYQVNIDFPKKSFSFFEWRNSKAKGLDFENCPREIGDLNLFKREIFSLKIWEWEPVYGTEDGITLGNTNWKVKLKTKSKTYISEGWDSYPENWHKFCKAIEKLTGTVFQKKI